MKHQQNCTTFMSLCHEGTLASSDCQARLLRSRVYFAARSLHMCCIGLFKGQFSIGSPYCWKRRRHLCHYVMKVLHPIARFDSFALKLYFAARSLHMFSIGLFKGQCSIAFLLWANFLIAVHRRFRVSELQSILSRFSFTWRIVFESPDHLGRH
jgi:hypothetical protein